MVVVGLFCFRLFASCLLALLWEGFLFFVFVFFLFFSFVLVLFSFVWIRPLTLGIKQPSTADMKVRIAFTSAGG